MLASIIQHYTYMRQVVNALPIVLLIVLVMSAWLFFVFAMAGDTLAPLLGTLVCLAFLAFPITMNWHHSEKAHATRIELIDPTTHAKVWLPAHKLPNGVWWPQGGKPVK